MEQLAPTVERPGRGRKEVGMSSTVDGLRATTRRVQEDASTVSRPAAELLYWEDKEKQCLHYTRTL